MPPRRRTPCCETICMGWNWTPVAWKLRPSPSLSPPGRYPGAEGYRAAAGAEPRLLGGSHLTRRRNSGSRCRERAAAAGGMPLERDLFDVDDNLLSVQVRDSLEALYDLFLEAPVLGSLIAPRALEGTLYQRDFEFDSGTFRAPFSNKNEPPMSRSSGP